MSAVVTVVEKQNKRKAGLAVGSLSLYVRMKLSVVKSKIAHDATSVATRHVLEDVEADPIH